jgi:hypothetical protein
MRSEQLMDSQKPSAPLWYAVCLHTPHGSCLLNAVTLYMLHPSLVLRSTGYSDYSIFVV